MLMYHKENSNKDISEKMNQRSCMQYAYITHGSRQWSGLEGVDEGKKEDICNIFNNKSFKKRDIFGKSPICSEIK